MAKAYWASLKLLTKQGLEPPTNFVCHNSVLASAKAPPKKYKKTDAIVDAFSHFMG
jgi:hypothetical protein